MIALFWGTKTVEWHPISVGVMLYEVPKLQYGALSPLLSPFSWYHNRSLSPWLRCFFAFQGSITALCHPDYIVSAFQPENWSRINSKGKYKIDEEKSFGSDGIEKTKKPFDIYNALYLGIW